MNQPRYYSPTGGLPPQTDLTTDRAVFTEAYAVLPRGTMRDIVTSALPHWDQTRTWIIARPLSGFAETFSQYIVEVSPGGGSSRAELDPGAEGVLFVVRGALTLGVDDQSVDLTEGGYAFLPPGAAWTIRNEADAPATFHWVRKAYEPVEGIEVPEAFVTNEADVAGEPMPGTDGVWSGEGFF
jgi:(S)-ureidoglycine aminohydrolase